MVTIAFYQVRKLDIGTTRDAGIIVKVAKAGVSEIQLKLQDLTSITTLRRHFTPNTYLKAIASTSSISQRVQASHTALDTLGYAEEILPEDLKELLYEQGDNGHIKYPLNPSNDRVNFNFCPIVKSV